MPRNVAESAVQLQTLIWAIEAEVCECCGPIALTSVSSWVLYLDANSDNGINTTGRGYSVIAGLRGLTIFI